MSDYYVGSTFECCTNCGRSYYWGLLNDYEKPTHLVIDLKTMKESFIYATKHEPNSHTCKEEDVKRRQGLKALGH